MTSYDAAVYRETLRCENNAKAEWIKQHGSTESKGPSAQHQQHSGRRETDHVCQLFTDAVRLFVRRAARPD